MQNKRDVVVMVEKRKGVRRVDDREEHDNICDRRFKPVWSLIGIMLLAFIFNGAYGYSKNEDMKSINATQDVKIENIGENVARVERKIDSQHIEQTQGLEKVLDKLDDLNEYMREHEH